VDELGVLLKPDYLTRGFPNLLEKHGLRKIRLHDLRHSCASLLLKSGVSMKAIQEWLGHSNFGTTANLYAHLEYESKQGSADAIGGALAIHLSGRECLPSNEKRVPTNPSTEESKGIQ